MSQRRDHLTSDMFAEGEFDLPTPMPATPGSVNLSREIAAVMSDALKACPHDRIEVAARMSRLMGREQSLHMLNAFTAESKEAYVPSIERALAFDIATEQRSVAEYYVSKLGGRILWGRDQLVAELGRIQQERTDLAAKERELRARLKRLPR